MSAHTPHLAGLPVEILQAVLCRLEGDSQARARLATTCRQFRRALQGPSCVWASLNLHSNRLYQAAHLASLVAWLRPRLCAVRAARLTTVEDWMQWAAVLPLLADGLTDLTLGVSYSQRDLPDHGQADRRIVVTTQLRQEPVNQAALLCTRLTSLRLELLHCSVGLSHLSELSRLTRLEVDYDDDSWEGQAADLPPELAALEQLQILDFSSPGLEYVPNLAPLTALTSLRLAACNLLTGPDGPDLNLLVSVRSLASLRLAAMVAALPRLDALTRLTRLELDGVTLAAAEEGVTFSARSLRELAIHCYATRECTLPQALGGFLGLPALQTLDLSQGLRRGLKAVPEGLDALSALTRLDLSNNSIKVPHTAGLARLRRLAELDVRNNPLRPKGLRALLNLRAQKPGVRVRLADDSWMP